MKLMTLFLFTGFLMSSAFAKISLADLQSQIAEHKKQIEVIAANCPKLLLAHECFEPEAEPAPEECSDLDVDIEEVLTCLKKPNPECVKKLDIDNFKLEVDERHINCQDLIDIANMYRLELEQQVYEYHQMCAAEEVAGPAPVENLASDISKILEQETAPVPVPVPETEIRACTPSPDASSCAKEITCSVLGAAAPVLAGVAKITGKMTNNSELEQCANRGGNCLMSILRGVFDSLWSSVNLLWDVGKLALTKTGELLGIVEKAETATSDKLLAAQQAGPGFIKRLTSDPLGTIKKLASDFYESMKVAAINHYGCQEWSGLPFASTCIAPLSNWDCASCGQKTQVFCGIAGYAAGEIGVAFLTGGLVSAGKTAVVSSLKIASGPAKAVAGLMAKTFPKATTVVVKASTKVATVGKAGIEITGKAATDTFTKVANSSTAKLITKAASTKVGKTVLYVPKMYGKALDKAFVGGYNTAEKIAAEAALNKATRLATVAKTKDLTFKVGQLESRVQAAATAEEKMTVLKSFREYVDAYPDLHTNPDYLKSVMDSLKKVRGEIPANDVKALALLDDETLLIQNIMSDNAVLNLRNKLRDPGFKKDKLKLFDEYDNAVKAIYGNKPLKDLPESHWLALTLMSEDLSIPVKLRKLVHERLAKLQKALGDKTPKFVKGGEKKIKKPAKGQKTPGIHLEDDFYKKYETLNVKNKEEVIEKVQELSNRLILAKTPELRNALMLDFKNFVSRGPDLQANPDFVKSVMKSFDEVRTGTTLDDAGKVAFESHAQDIQKNIAKSLVNKNGVTEPYLLKPNETKVAEPALRAQSAKPVLPVMEQAKQEIEGFVKLFKESPTVPEQKLIISDLKQFISSNADLSANPDYIKSVMGTFEKIRRQPKLDGSLLPEIATALKRSQDEMANAVGLELWYKLKEPVSKAEKLKLFANYDEGIKSIYGGNLKEAAAFELNIKYLEKIAQDTSLPETFRTMADDRLIVLSRSPVTEILPRAPANIKPQVPVKAKTLPEIELIDNKFKAATTLVEQKVVLSDLDKLMRAQKTISFSPTKFIIIKSSLAYYKHLQDDPKIDSSLRQEAKKSYNAGIDFFAKDYTDTLVTSLNASTSDEERVQLVQEYGQAWKDLFEMETPGQDKMAMKTYLDNALKSPGLTAETQKLLSDMVLLLK